MHLTPLPYLHPTGTILNTLIVQSTIKDETSSSGLFTPSDIANLCEKGIVIACAENTPFKPGDEVLYKKVNRLDADLNTVTIDNKECDILFENEVWSINGVPYNRLFIEVIEESAVTESGLILSDRTEGVPEKAVLFAAPENHLYFKKGDILEFRKDKGIYPQVRIEDKTYTVIFEKDVFTVNGEVSPHRIIVSIDVPAQKIKRETTESGFVRSPLFAAMLYNLQYGKVIAIGAEAKKIYPDLSPGDTAILHHTIESQAYRLLKTFAGKHIDVIEEHRMINCFDLRAREIFGKIIWKKVFNKREWYVVPFHKNVFLNYKFEVFEKRTSKESAFLLDLNNTMEDCTEIEDLKIHVRHDQEDASKTYAAQFQGYISDIERLDPGDWERRKFFDTKIAQLKEDSIKAGTWYRRNHYLKCKIEFPMTPKCNILVPYKELYPINILGKKFLIAHSDLIIANISTDMGKTIVQPIGKKVLVRPIEDATASMFYIPDASKEKPQKGIVVAIGDEVTHVKAGDTVLYKKLAGTDVEIDGEVLLSMWRNDLEAVVTEQPNDEHAVSSYSLTHGGPGTEINTKIGMG